MFLKEENSLLKHWIKEFLSTKNFNAAIQSITEHEGGLTGELYFVRVINYRENESILNLVVKVGKSDTKSKENTEKIREMCKREIYFYEKVLPAFEKFQQSKNVSERFYTVPKCYKTFPDDDVIVMDNMKSLGYEVYPRKLPLNAEHMRMGLTTFAKFHALSLALQDQDKCKFNNLTENYQNLTKMWISLKPIIESKPSRIFQKLKEVGRDDLAAKCEERFMKKGFYNHLMELLKDVPMKKAILHVDGHNGNFLFKYKDDDKRAPVSMVLIDFQTSIVHSPMMDISFFLYINLSKYELPQFEDFVEFYSSQLSLFLIQLGSDPGEIFSSDLVRDHMKKYSLFGFLLAFLFLDLLYITKKELSSFENDEHFKDITLTSEEMYLERLVAIVEHYFTFYKI